ncbi:hypothetical protein E1B28_002258 [Marasmius oreades]|uniref:Uncharacterized protein n=1 Tax=Marasmius oreades TaxID=181124 RepID=A0A9P7RMA6_9AGAR|nr:uncharacterized protein E1B28_002258 [Marasmius oreades]KAG7086294.1 hypothetical protein E1B28_002258 [Marasmius oreades]
MRPVCVEHIDMFQRPGLLGHPSPSRPPRHHASPARPLSAFRHNSPDRISGPARSSTATTSRRSSPYPTTSPRRDKAPHLRVRFASASPRSASTRPPTLPASSNRLNSDLSSSEEDDNDDEEDQEEVRMETDTETIESDADSDKPINVHVRQNNNFEVESDADVDGFMDDSDDEDTKPDGTSKIRKPPGEVGRPNSGGYSLEKFLNWPASKYHSVMAFVKKQVHAEFNCALSLTEQLPENRERVWRNCLKKFPWLDDYHRLWPVDDFAVSRLKYAKSVIKKKEREALLEKCCDKSEAKGPRKTKNQRRKTSVRASARLGRRE